MADAAVFRSSAAPAGAEATPLTVSVVSAVGVGPTELAAFDAALLAAGIGNFNLLLLSSVIPPGTVVRSLDGPARLAGSWGDRLYVVLAEDRASEPGVEVAAAIGWVQEEDTGRGLFVEHKGHSEEAARRQVMASLGAMTASRGGQYGSISVSSASAICEGTPTCALVAAVFGSVPWHAESGIDLRDW